MPERSMFSSRDIRPVRPPQQPADRPVAAAPPAQQPEAAVPQKRRKAGFLKRRWWVVLIVLVVIAAMSALAYGYVTTRNELTKLSGSGNSPGKSETENLVKEISVYLQLPDETPQLATVEDVSKLNGQEFFKDAQNDDKVLIFSQAGRALLYRPSTHKVIEYARVDLSGGLAN